MEMVQSHMIFELKSTTMSEGNVYETVVKPTMFYGLNFQDDLIEKNLHGRRSMM